MHGCSRTTPAIEYGHSTVCSPLPEDQSLLQWLLGSSDLHTPCSVLLYKQRKTFDERKGRGREGKRRGGGGGGGGEDTKRRREREGEREGGREGRREREREREGEKGEGGEGRGGREKGERG